MQLHLLLTFLSSHFSCLKHFTSLQFFRLYSASVSRQRHALLHYLLAGTEFQRSTGDMYLQLLDIGGHDIFCHPQYLVIKNNVVVQTSWLPYC